MRIGTAVNINQFKQLNSFISIYILIKTSVHIFGARRAQNIGVYLKE